jgi:L-aminopeptidase/D-esterase-like protein
MQSSQFENDSITAVPGISVGHWTDVNAPTGCTVVLCEGAAVASVDVRGGAPATRETDLLRAGNFVERVHAVLLSGGSAFGLDAASGVMRWLEEREIGFPVTGGVVPIVPAACLYDLTITEGRVRPGAEDGYSACEAASDDVVDCGSAGAGAGATVGKALGIERCVRGGIGSAVERTASGIAIGALVAVNSWGEVVDPENGRTVAGVRGDEPGSFRKTVEVLREAPPMPPFSSENSTLAVVATDAVLTRDQAYRVAVIAQTGLARTIRPVHTPVDGDIVFSLATCRNEAATDILQVGALASRALERAVLKAVGAATSFGDVPSVTDWA